MPIYEFECGKCGKESEILVRSSRWKGTKCPHCGSTKLSKKLSVFAGKVAENGCNPAEGCCMGMEGKGKRRGGGGCCGGSCGHAH